MGQVPKVEFLPLEVDERPHDPSGTGKGWQFETQEHDQHTFPHAIKATDQMGRSAIYVPLKRRGKIGKWIWHTS